MADSVTATDIPPGAFPLVAGYVDGAYAWTDADWLFHHNSRLVRITVFGGGTDADVIDVESGDATPAQAAQWAIGRKAAGKVPTVYVQASRFGEVVAAFAAAGAPYPYFWIADWDNVNGPWYGSIAKQYQNPTLSGAHYDVSWVADHWPGVDPELPTGPVPTPDPGYSFGPTPGGYQTWAWKLVGAPGGPQFGPTPAGTYTWEWALLQTPGDLGSYPGGPTWKPPAPPPTPGQPPTAPGPPLDQVRAAWTNLGNLLTTDVPNAVAELLRLLGLYSKAP